MWLTVLLSLLATLVASLPLCVSRRDSWLNPATYVFLIAGASLLGKSLYIALLRPLPNATRHDGIWVDAVSSDVFVLGATMGLVALAAYVAGFFLVAGRRLGLAWPEGAVENSLASGGLTLWLAAVVATTMFGVYLLSSGSGVHELLTSAKRFQPLEIGVKSRFAFWPYYFFKAASLAGSAAVAGALLFYRSGRRRTALLFGFTYLYCFALYVSCYASLRQFILCVLAQVLLVAIYFGRRWTYPLTGLLVVITVASLGVTTLRYRVPRLVKAPEQRLDTKVAATSPVTHRRLRWLASGAFGGRYFLDVGKLAHLGHHFPEDRNFLWGRTLVRLPVSEGGESLSLDRYLAIHVFHEPSNSIPPGFAGELYINFGWVGLVLGLLGLGALHRLVFNYLAPRQHSWLVVGCLLVVIPASTLVLFNSSLAAAGLRGVIDVAVVVAICVSPTRLGRWLWPNRRRA